MGLSKRCADRTTAICTRVTFHHLQIWSELYGTKYQAVHTSHQHTCGADDVYRSWATLVIVRTTPRTRLREKAGRTGANRLAGDTFRSWPHSPPYSVTHTTDRQNGRRPIEEKAEPLTDLLPQFYLWSPSQQANCITNRLIIQKGKRRCWARERWRDGHKNESRSWCQLAVKKGGKKLDFFFFCNKKSSCQNSLHDKCSLKLPVRSPRLFFVKRGGGCRVVPEVWEMVLLN